MSPYTFPNWGLFVLSINYRRFKGFGSDLDSFGIIWKTIKIKNNVFES